MNESSNRSIDFFSVHLLNFFAVALVAQSGGCSITEKAQVAANLINPANNVQYLIIQGQSKRHKYKYEYEYEYDDVEEGNNDDETSSSFISSSHYVSSKSQALLQSLTGNGNIDDDDDESYYVSKNELDVSEYEQQHNGRVLTHLTDMTEQTETTNNNTNNNVGGPPGDVNLAVLHVSYAAGVTLFNLIDTENPINHRQGG